MPKTPHGVEIPRNHSDLGRPVRALNFADPAWREFLTQPNAADHIRQAVASARLTPDQEQEIRLALRHTQRHLNDARALPGETMGRDDLPYEPMPFEAREGSLYPPGSPQADAARDIVSRLEADDMTSALTRRMAGHDPSQSTWARAAPPGERAAPTSEPSRRDQVAAAFNAFNQE